MGTERQNAGYPEVQSGATAMQDAAPRLRRLPDDGPSPEQIELWRAMPGQRRLELAEALYWEARELKAAGVRHQHPGWSDEQVTAEVNLNART